MRGMTHSTLPTSPHQALPPLTLIPPAFLPLTQWDLTHTNTRSWACIHVCVWTNVHRNTHTHSFLTILSVVAKHVNMSSLWITANGSYPYACTHRHACTFAHTWTHGPRMHSQVHTHSAEMNAFKADSHIPTGKSMNTQVHTVTQMYTNINTNTYMQPS